jgi:hypothetical protein
LQKTRVYPDGALLYSLRVPLGYWEAKDEDDDLDKEIEKKFRKGYPQDNIIFEDSDKAVGESALPPKAAAVVADRRVRFGPIGDIRPLQRPGTRVENVGMFGGLHACSQRLLWANKRHRSRMVAQSAGIVN